jgi:riboflavin synthase
MEVGSIRSIERRADGAYLVVQAKAVLEGTKIGDSITINGADLTVIRMGADFFSADASLETLSRTNLGQLATGSPVNLERALGLGERLGGHIVQGHIDETGSVISVIPEGNAYRLRVGFPQNLEPYIAMKGSITVDGISLTVAALGRDWFEVAVIPHTWKNTIVRHYKPGDRVNLEVDVLAKYVERILATRTEAGEPESKLTVDYLIDQGF